MIRRLLKPKLLLLLIIVAGVVYGIYWFRQGVRMPGRSYSGPLQPLDAYQARLRDNLRTHVEMLAGQIGERNLQHLDSLNRAADYIRQNLEQDGYSVSEDTYQVQGAKFRILYTNTLGGNSGSEPFVIGAHYDSVVGSPGANDNTSGVAAVLELARTLKNETPRQPILFALFPNEEPPWFQTNNMGSLVFARGFHRDYLRFRGMISIETIGYYSDQPGSQKYPAGIASLYPSTGNFIGFVGDLRSRDLLKNSVAEFRRTTHFPAEGASLAGSIEGVGWSDHWSFWQVGVPAIMVTDTAPFRYPYYHRADDTPDKLDYDRMARVVLGLRNVVLKLSE
jgi:peptidase M28-like protein